MEHINKCRRVIFGLSSQKMTPIVSIGKMHGLYIVSIANIIE